MKQQPQKLKDLKSKFQSLGKKNFLIGSIVATIIATSPYLFYSYESVPDTPVWNTFLFTYNSGNFQNANVAFWILTSKFVPLLLLLIWFFTCKHWWFHAIIVPIAMYSYQIFMTLKQDLMYVDHNQLIYLIPLMAIIVPSIYLIRAKMFNEINTANKSLEELEDEFKISPKNFWDKIKQYF